MGVIDNAMARAAAVAGPWWEAPAHGSPTGPPPWAVLDYVTRDLTAGPAAGTTGETLTATIGPVPDGHLWGVTRSTISVVYSTTPEDLTQPLPVLRHYLDTPQNSVISGSNTGDYDEADYPYPGLWVPAGRSLLAVWGARAGATIGVQAGGIAHWHVQYADLVRGGY